MTLSTAPLFTVQADRWLENGKTRNRNPWRPATVKNYVSQIEKHLKPVLGQIPLDAIGNKAVRDLSASLVQKKLKPASIQLILNIIKEIRASALGVEGEQLYPYTWNTEFIDAPIVDKKAQKTPKASAAAIQAGFSCACASQGTKLLLAVLAGSGLRIQEALALRVTRDDGVSTIWVPDESKIIVRQQRDDLAFATTKTTAGQREIDLPTELNDWLQFRLNINDLNGLVFPKSEALYRSELIRCKVIGGFHSLRRFRVTHLKMQGVPSSLIHFWIGHEDDDGVTSRYTEVGSEIEARKMHANKAGLGFALPDNF
jgi:integrase